jgi:hypothetical protein
LGNKRNRLVIVVVLMLVLAGAVEPQGTPDTGLLKAAYEPGGTCDDCYEWRINISTDGSFGLEAKTEPGWHAPDVWRTRSEGRLSQKQIDRIVAVIVNSRFLSLSPRYSTDYVLPNGGIAMMTDQDTVTIWTKVGSQENQVRVYGPEVVAGLSHPDRPHRDREAGKSFCAVWAQLLNSVKSPNRWQKAKYYR